MKLKAVFLFIGLVLGCFSYGQIKIGDQPQNIDPASVLELQSTSRTLVLTRVNNTQMNAITPLQGALIYNTETKCVHYYDGDQWLNICDALTNSVNISLEDNGDGSYTFTDAVGVATTFTIATNSTFEVANDSLVLTDSNNNALSVALDSLNRHTYSSDAVVNLPTSDSTIVITKTANNYNFEVGEITGLNILDRSITREDIAGTAINGDFHIQNRSTPVLKLVPGTNGQLLQTQTVTGQPTVVWVNKAGLFTAAEVSYNPVDSGLAALDVKAAIDELSTSSNSLTIGDILTQGNDAGAQLIRNVLDPSSAQDVATRNYVDTQVSNSNILADANIFVGDAAGTAQAVPVSGDATMDNTGALTISDNAVTSSMILDGTIDSADIAVNAIGEPQLNQASVTEIKIRPGATNQVLTTNGIGTVQWVNRSGLISATEVSYTPTSGLISTNAQGAIDEVAASNAADLDIDPSNEFNTGIAFDGTSLTVTDAGGDQTINISSVSTDDQIATEVSYIPSSGLISTNVQGALDEVAASNAADLDIDPANEFNTGIAFDGTSLTVTDAGGDQTINISGVSTDDQTATEVSYTPSSGLISTNVQGALDEVAASNAADLDIDPSNEFNTGIAFDGTSLTVTDAGGDQTINISGVSTDDQTATEVSYTPSSGLISTNVQGALDEVAASNAADLDIDPANEFNTGIAFDGTSLTVTDAGGDQTINISSVSTDDQIATEVSYTPSSGLISTNVQGAIDELALSIDQDLGNSNLTQTAAVDRTYDINGQNLSFTNGQVAVGIATPTSTLHTGGSLATAITTTTAPLTLSDLHHTIILGGDHNIILPTPVSCLGRIYIIKNTTTFTPTISSYINSDGSANPTIIGLGILQLQSDGTNWQQIN